MKAMQSVIVSNVFFFFFPPNDIVGSHSTSRRKKEVGVGNSRWKAFEENIRICFYWMERRWNQKLEMILIFNQNLPIGIFKNDVKKYCNLIDINKYIYFLFTMTYGLDFCMTTTDSSMNMPLLRPWCLPSHTQVLTCLIQRNFIRCFVYCK